MKKTILKRVLPAFTTLGFALAVAQGCGLQMKGSNSSVQDVENNTIELCGEMSLRPDHEPRDGGQFSFKGADFQAVLALSGEALTQTMQQLSEGNTIKCVTVAAETSEIILISDASQIEFGPSAVQLCGKSRVRGDHEISDGLWFKIPGEQFPRYLILQGEALDKAAKNLGQGLVVSCVNLEADTGETIIVSEPNRLEFAKKPAVPNGTFTLLDCESADYPLGRRDSEGNTVRNSVKMSVQVENGRAVAVSAKIKMPGYIPEGGAIYTHSVQNSIDSARVFRATETSSGLVVFPALFDATLNYTVEGFTGTQALESVSIDQNADAKNIRFEWKTRAENGSIRSNELYLKDSCKVSNAALLGNILE